MCYLPRKSSCCAACSSKTFQSLLPVGACGVGHGFERCRGQRHRALCASRTNSEVASAVITSSASGMSMETGLPVTMTTCNPSSVSRASRGNRGAQEDRRGTARSCVAQPGSSMFPRKGTDVRASLRGQVTEQRRRWCADAKPQAYQRIRVDEVPRGARPFRIDATTA